MPMAEVSVPASVSFEALDMSLSDVKRKSKEGFGCKTIMTLGGDRDPASPTPSPRPPKFLLIPAHPRADSRKDGNYSRKYKITSHC